MLWNPFPTVLQSARSSRREPMISRFLAALLFAGAQVQDKPPAAGEEEVVVVKKGNLTPTLELDVTFEATESAEIKPRMETYQGELTLVRVATPGQAVRKGDPILVLD